MRQSEERFRLLAELAPVGIVISDANENIIYLSSKFIEMFGYTKKDMPNVEAWCSLAYPDENLRNEVRNQWRQYVEDSSVHKTDAQPLVFPVTCKDQNIKHIEFRLATDRNLNFAILVDVTERKQAEEALARSERQLRELFENAPVGIFRATPQGRYLSLNPEYARLIGYENPLEMMDQITD